MARIVLNNVHVRYPVTQDHYRSLRRLVARVATRGRLYGEDVGLRTVHAIRGLSLNLEKGDRVGLIGRNGAGKSTLLKTLGGFILPDEGTLDVEGSIMPLFSVSAGMDEERSGYDNIFLSGRLLGIPRHEMEKNVADIEAFCELGQFLYMPVRMYSDGMKVRLGFAISTCISPDILLLDEAIGAGDAHFLEKASKRAEALYNRANILIIASHSPEIITRLCNKALWLSHGTMVEFGPAEEVLAKYLNTMNDADTDAAA